MERCGVRFQTPLWGWTLQLYSRIAAACRLSSRRLSLTDLDIPGWILEQCFREQGHQQPPDIGQLLVSYLQGLLLRIVYCGPALRAPPPPPFATHLYFFNGILELVFFIRLSMALLIRLIMALFTRPKIGLFHPTLTPDDQERAGGASRVFLQGSK